MLSGGFAEISGRRPRVPGAARVPSGAGRCVAGAMTGNAGEWCLMESDPGVFTELIKGFGERQGDRHGPGDHGGGPGWVWRGVSLRPPPPRVGRQATPETWRDSGRGKCRAPTPFPAPDARVSAVIVRATPRGQDPVRACVCVSVHGRGFRIRRSVIRFTDLSPRPPSTPNPFSITLRLSSAASLRGALHAGQVCPGAGVRPAALQEKLGCAFSRVGSPRPQPPGNPRFQFFKAEQLECEELCGRPRTQTAWDPRATSLVLLIFVFR